MVLMHSARLLAWDVGSTWRGSRFRAQDMGVSQKYPPLRVQGPK